MSAQTTPISNNSAAWIAETKTTFLLAWPLIIAQLAQIAFFTTDVVMMGWLGSSYLAAGALATALLHPIAIGGFGVISATAPMVAQAIGARDLKSIRRTVRQGFWVALLLSVGSVFILYQAAAIFGLLGQDPDTTRNAAIYLKYAAWSVPPTLIFMVLRNFISAKGKTGAILTITITAVVLNAIFNYGLMFGNFGLPRLELVGAGIATIVTNVMMMIAALIYATTHKQFKRHYILVRFLKPDWPRFFEFLRIGWPVGLTLVSEIGLFSGAVIFMGWLGSDYVAAHAIALQCAAISFMFPLGLSQATTIRVGLMQGRRQPEGVAIAGWVSLALCSILMAFTCAAFIFIPQVFIGIFLDASDPANAEPISLAVSFLVVAGFFQFFDGAQVAMASSLRGMSDTRIPMMFAVFGYWVVGIGTAYVAGFVWNWGGVGIWVGLATGLGFVSVAMVVRWTMRERLGLVDHPTD